MGSHLSIETQNHPVDSEQIIIAKHLLINRIKDLIKGIARTRGGLFGMIFIIGMILTAVFAPFISPFDPYEQDIINRFSGPSLDHFMGTDYLGRDILSRIIYGCRIATMVSFGSVTLSAFVGVIMGVLFRVCHTVRFCRCNYGRAGRIQGRQQI